MTDTPNPQLAERLMLSAMLMHPDAVWDALEIIPGDHLIEPRHDMVLAALRALADAGRPTDVIAVVDRLTAIGELNRVGGAAYLHSLVGLAPTHVNVGFYAEIVRAEVERRRLVAAGESIKSMAEDPSIPPVVRAERARAVVDEALAVPTDTNITPADSLQATFEQIGTVAPGIPTPWEPLTQMLHGFAPGRLYVIGARPRMGKTAFALQCASALQRHGTVGFFSHEMSTKELELRLMSQGTGVALNALTNGKHLNEPFRSRVQEWILTPPHKIVIDEDTVDLAGIHQRVRTWSRQHPDLAAIVVDHIQLTSVGGRRAENRVQELSEISRSLKLMAKQYGVPVLALSQLNRAADVRADRTPVLADLRDSGTIEQDADVVILLYREDPDDDAGQLQVGVAKNRHGAARKLLLDWQGTFVRAV